MVCAEQRRLQAAKELADTYRDELKLQMGLAAHPPERRYLPDPTQMMSLGGTYLAQIRDLCCKERQLEEHMVLVARDVGVAGGGGGSGAANPRTNQKELHRPWNSTKSPELDTLPKTSPLATLMSTVFHASLLE